MSNTSNQFKDDVIKNSEQENRADAQDKLVARQARPVCLSGGNLNSCPDAMSADAANLVHGVSGLGAPSSNTAPSNYITLEKGGILISGV
jgi:hypothetical protein